VGLKKEIIVLRVVFWICSTTMMETTTGRESRKLKVLEAAAEWESNSSYGDAWMDPA
jgi:hypothetical protein